MAATNLPIFLAALSRFFGKDFENVPALKCPVGDDSWTNLECSNKLHGVVEKPEVLCPTSEGKMFNCHEFLF
jgi:hypothetical protein